MFKSKAKENTQKLIRIIEFEQRHLEKICEIENSSFPEPFSDHYLADLGKLYSDTFLIAEWNYDAVGYIVAKTDCSRAHILSIAVENKWRRKQIGFILLQMLIIKLKSKRINEIILEVEKNNIPAKKLYERIGFKLIKEIKNYYLNGEDALLYYFYI
ncbi:ribosomal protein S18-alanine N-acetyltransferase [[Eubacterium] cellulosolvens]